MSKFHITLVERQTVLSTYAVRADDMDSALKRLAEDGRGEEYVDSETLESTFLRFKQICNPVTGERQDVTEDQNKHLLGEDYVA